MHCIISLTQIKKSIKEKRGCFRATQNCIKCVQHSFGDKPKHGFDGTAGDFRATGQAHVQRQPGTDDVDVSKQCDRQRLAFINVSTESIDPVTTLTRKLRIRSAKCGGDT